MKALIGVLVALALAVSISACGGTPTEPSCNGNGGGVPASTVASITGIKMWLGNETTIIEPESVTEAEGVKTYRFVLPRVDFMGFVVTAFNPRAESREMKWTFTDGTSQNGSNVRFEEPFNPNPYVRATDSLIRPDQRKGQPITYTLAGEETGGNLLNPTPLRAVVVVTQGW